MGEPERCATRDVLCAAHHETLRGAGKADNPAAASRPIRKWSDVLYGLGARPVEFFALVIAHDARREILKFDEIVCLAS